MVRGELKLPYFMKKIFLFIFIFLSLFAAYSSSFSISIAPSVYTTRLSMAFENNRFEYSLGFQSGFPNLYIPLVLNAPEDNESTLFRFKKAFEESFNFNYGFNLAFSYSVLSNKNNMIKLGVNTHLDYSKNFDNLLLSTLGATFNYTYVFNHSALFFETEIPLFLYGGTEIDRVRNMYFATLFSQNFWHLLYFGFSFNTRLGYMYRF